MACMDEDASHLVGLAMFPAAGHAYSLHCPMPTRAGPVAAREREGRQAAGGCVPCPSPKCSSRCLALQSSYVLSPLLRSHVHHSRESWFFHTFMLRAHPQGEISAVCGRVQRFIIDREIEAPERFQAIQSYR